MGITATGGCPESAGPVGPPCQGNRSEPVAEGRTAVDVTARMVASVTTRKARTKTLTLADRGISPRVSRRELPDAPQPLRSSGLGFAGARSPPRRSDIYQIQADL